MGKFKPSKLQQDIFDFITHGEGSAIIEAVAGSGKTTTICEALALIPSNKKILFCAFNKSIATELAERVPDYVNVKTLNGIGHGAWMRFTDARVNLNTRKTVDIMKSESFLEQFGEWPIKRLGSKVRKLVSIAKSSGLVPEGADEDADNGLVPDVQETWDDIIDHFDIDFMMKTKVGVHPNEQKRLEAKDKETAIEMARECLRRGLEEWNTIDFDDQLYHTVAYDVPCFRYDYVFVDEAQDISHIQRILLKKHLKSGGRLIAVGDPCQPGNTVVETVDGPKKFSDIKIGDMVISGDVSHSTFRLSGRKVTGITKKLYKDVMVEIETENSKFSSYTINHHCVVNFKPLSQKYCIYVMRKNNRFRIGQCKFSYSQGLGVRTRMASEQADSAWILSIHDTKKESIIHEAILSERYNLPTITFKSANSVGPLDVKALNRIWKTIGSNELAANECLNDFYRDIKYPMYQKGTPWKAAAKRPCIVRACNLLKGGLVLTYSGKSHYQKNNWSPIKVVTYNLWDDYVYSINVEKDHTYVGDGILTHNCQAVYGFRGADSESLNNIGKLFRCKRFPLSISYRCPKLVVNEAQQYVSHIQSHESAPDGTVVDWGHLNRDKLKEFKQDDFIICRNTSPLIKLAFHLIRLKKPVTVLGRDIGKNLINLIQKLNPMDLSDLADKLEAWKEKEVKKLLDKDPDANVSRIEEREECIHVFTTSSGATTVPALIEAIDNLFGEARDIRRCIILSTIHKSKGLEAERVFILDSWLMPSKYAKKAWQLEQENNLQYVSITRSKSFLCYMKSPKKAG